MQYWKGVHSKFEHLLPSLRSNSKDELQKIINLMSSSIPLVYWIVGIISSDVRFPHKTETVRFRATQVIYGWVVLNLEREKSDEIRQCYLFITKELLKELIWEDPLKYLHIAIAEVIELILRDDTERWDSYFGDISFLESLTSTLSNLS